MRVVDEITGEVFSLYQAIKVVVRHLPDQIIFGYVGMDAHIENCLFYEQNNGLVTLPCVKELLGDIFIYSKRHGLYMSKVGCPDKVLLGETMILGMGNFPYDFTRKYEAIDNIELFRGKQKILTPRKYELSDYMNYTFGLEFETSQGYIPEDICFRDGLIPLRDGSISGLEYSTIILSGSEGISLLKQQTDTLKEYTNFNKECSLHMHFGGFPLEPDKLFRLYTLCKKLEPCIQEIVPNYTFHSGEYKMNGKDYCKRLPNYRSFNQMYEHLVGIKFFGSFTQPHPKDIERRRKWQINTRYFWINFINALCYNVNKTIEFRLLRPTYNFKKILVWIYIFNAILRYAEGKRSCSGVNLEDVIEEVYPEKISANICTEVMKLRYLEYNRRNNNDMIGEDMALEDKLFPNI